MKLNKWAFFDGLCGGIGTLMLYQAFFVEWSLLACFAGVLGVIQMPLSLLLGTYESIDNKEVR